MQDRLNQNDVTNRVNVENPANVREAVLRLFAVRYPGADFAGLEHAFDDCHALFAGRHPGYLGCDTLYHDMRHTLDMTLAMARLVDGHDRSCAPTDRRGPTRPHDRLHGRHRRPDRPDVGPHVPREGARVPL